MLQLPMNAPLAFSSKPPSSAARSAGVRRLRLMMSGSAALPVHVLERWRGADPQLAPSPQFAIERPHHAGVAVGRRLAPAFAVDAPDTLDFGPLESLGG